MTLLEHQITCLIATNDELRAKNAELRKTNKKLWNALQCATKPAVNKFTAAEKLFKDTGNGEKKETTA